MVTAVSTIANGGNHVTPRVVKQIIDSKTGEVKDIEVKKQEGVISKKTSEDVLSMMKSVVAEGTGKNAKVEGYSIGGKTGTSEDGVNTGKYVTSFIGVAPIEDPEVVVLVTLYNPTGEGGHQGGGVAAPVGGQIFSEVLPYLEVQKEENEEDMIMEIEVPNLIGLTIKEAKDKLKELDLEIEYEKGEEEVLESEITIKEQLPNTPIVLHGASTVIPELVEMCNKFGGNIPGAKGVPDQMLH